MESHHWEADLAELLIEIGSAERALFQLIAQSRRLVASRQTHESHAWTPCAARLAARLRICHERRRLLQQAAQAQPGAADRLRRCDLDHWLVLLERLLDLSQLLLRRGEKLRIRTADSGRLMADRGGAGISSSPQPLSANRKWWSLACRI